jgi:S1-C subfamily serine protease
MELNIRKGPRSAAPLKGAALVACAIALSAPLAGAQDRGTQERIVQEQRRQSSAPTGWFGVTVNDNGTIDEHGNPFYTGYPIVTTVEPESPAAKAGVKVGDILLTFNDHDMKGSAMALRNWLRPGSSFVVRLRRDGAAKQVRGVIGKRPSDFDQTVTLIWTTEGDRVSEMGGGGGAMGGPVSVRVRTPLPSKLPPVLAPSFTFGGGVYPFAGAEFIALNPDLSDALGVGREGIFVTTVMPESPAQIAGLRGGDVVLTADSIRLDDPIDLVRAIRESGDRSIKLGVVRKKKAQTILLKW